MELNTLINRMKVIPKIKVNTNNENLLENFLELMDDSEKLVLSIPIEFITADNLKNQLQKNALRNSIWDTCFNLLKEKNIEKYILREVKNGEYYGEFILDNNEKIQVRPSDGIIICLKHKIPFMVENALLSEEFKTEEIVDNTTIDDQIQTAIKAENFKLAGELKKKKNENRN